MEDLHSYGENVAAISGMMHEDKKIYEKIYNKLADQVGGFVGLWSICADLAKVFTIAEAPYTAGEDFYWIEAIEDFTHQIIECLQEGEVPKTAKVRHLAISAIKKNLVA